MVFFRIDFFRLLLAFLIKQAGMGLVKNCLSIAISF